jgi:hypothetical protein
MPATLSFHLSVSEASLLLVLRTLQFTQPNTPTPPSFTSFTNPFTNKPFTAPSTSDAVSLRQRLGLAAKLPEHDETGQVFTYKGQEVRVREKVRVESQDPSLMAVMAKLSALEHVVVGARRSLAIVMGQDDDD